ncbi:MAG: DUF4870 domain-containing protein [Candidatus Sericytochromatia bacterium]|nr:DUF4870 domain-containing protein [Candidatus Sericytochromatia bacterium]
MSDDLQQASSFRPAAPAGEVTGLERLAAGVAHGAPFLGVPLLAPFLIWLLFPLLRPSPYVRHQAMQAVLFHLFAVILLTPLWAAAMALWYVILIGWPFALPLTILAGVVSLWMGWVVLVATWKALHGEAYRMPVVGGFTRVD